MRWRVDYTLSSSELQEVSEPVVHLTFNVRDRECEKMTAVPVTLSANKFWVLLAGEASEGWQWRPGGFCRGNWCGRHVGKGMLEVMLQYQQLPHISVLSLQS